MTINETSFENWPRLTVLFETTRTSFVKTVAKKVIGVGNVHNRECIAPMSSVVFVVEVSHILMFSNRIPFSSSFSWSYGTRLPWSW